MENGAGWKGGKQEGRVSRRWPKCQTPLAGDNKTEFCPVCMLRIALSATLELGEEELRGTARPDPSGDRFEHYELVLRDDGTPLELGRGAMGVTFKAIDVNLRRP